MKTLDFENDTWHPFDTEPVEWLHTPLKEKAKAAAPRMFGTVHLVLHCTYLGTVYFEGHGIHSWAAAILLGTTVLGVGLGFKAE